MSGNHFCLFPSTKQAQALAYKAACDAHYAGSYEPGGTAVWCQEDAFGNWATQLYAPPFDPDGTGTFVEPEGFDVLRADAAISPTFTPKTTPGGEV